MFGNNRDASRFHSGRNQDQIEVRECLLTFSTECFVFQFAIQKYEGGQNDNFCVLFCMGAKLGRCH